VLSIPETEARKKWVKENTSTVCIRLNHNTDSDIVKKLDTITNRQGYIKELIRQDIAKKKANSREKN